MTKLEKTLDKELKIFEKEFIVRENSLYNMVNNIESDKKPKLYVKVCLYSKNIKVEETFDLIAKAIIKKINSLR